eukprot:gene22008-28100_t
MDVWWSSVSEGKTLNSISFEINSMFARQGIRPALAELDLQRRFGIITTTVGTGSSGSHGDRGPASSATVQYPSYVFIDSSSSRLYITEQGPNDIRVVSLITNIITLAAGNQIRGYSGDGGPATSASMFPIASWGDTAGNLFIAQRDYNNHVRSVG